MFNPVTTLWWDYVTRHKGDESQSSWNPVILFIVSWSTGKSLNHSRSLIKIVTIITESVNHHEKWEIADSWMGMSQYSHRDNSRQGHSVSSWAWRTDESLDIKITSCRLKQIVSHSLVYLLRSCPPPTGQRQMKCYSPTHQLIPSPLVFHCSQFHFSSNFNLSLWPEGNNVSGIIFCTSRGITLSLCLSISTVSFYMITVAGFLLCVKNIKTQRYHLTVEQFKQLCVLWII